MRSMRLGGGADGDAQAFGGAAASSQGSAIETPAHWRNVRRESFISRISLFREKESTFHHVLEERPEGILLRAGPRDELRHYLAVGELDVRSCRVDDQLLREIACQEILVRKEELFVVIDILEGSAVGR